MKKVISFILIFILLIPINNEKVSASEDEISTITVVNFFEKKDNREEIYKVILKENDVMFSGEDLAKMSGYMYVIENGKAVFSRGAKEVKIDLNKNTYTAFDDLSDFKFSNKIIKKENQYYYSGAEIIPWLNISLEEKDGTIYYKKDTVSYWDISEKFSNEIEKYLFNFEDCCEEMEVNNKWVKAMAYVTDEGILGMLEDSLWVPGSSITVGNAKEYMEIFEDMISDASRFEYSFGKIAEDAEVYSALADTLDSLGEIEELSEELQIVAELSEAIGWMENIFEVAAYIQLIQNNNKEVVNWLKIIYKDEEADKYSQSMWYAATEVSKLYDKEITTSDYIDKIIYAAGDAIVDFFWEFDIDEKAESLFALFGLVSEISLDWLKDINYVGHYNTISQFSVNGFKKIKNYTYYKDIEAQRAYAMLYLYSTEHNWRVMADYAKKKKSDLSEKYESIADELNEWQGKFLASVSSTENDSHNYGSGYAKTEYVDKLRSIFSRLYKNVGENDNVPIVPTEPSGEDKPSSDNGSIVKNLIKTECYDADGSMKYYFEYIYDKNNKAQLVNRLYCEAGKDAYIEREYTYDKNGNCIKEVEFYSDGEFDVYNYEYDSRGNLVCEYGNDGGEKYRFEYKFDSKDNLIEQIEYDGKGNVEYYRKGEYEYDAKGNVLELQIYDESNKLKQEDKFIYNDGGVLAAKVTSYYNGEKISGTRKFVYNYYSDGQVCDEQIYENEKQIGLISYDKYGNTIDRTYYNESGEITDVTYYSRVYDADKKLRSVAIMDDNGVSEKIVYEYSLNKDIKSEVINQYWYKYEYAIGGYTRYKFNPDGTYESLWLSDYSPNNKIMKGTYKIEDDRIVIDDADYYYDSVTKTFSFESISSSIGNPLYGGFMKFSLNPSKTCYEEYSAEMENALRNAK